jgi:hypothetical protein
MATTTALVRQDRDLCNFAQVSNDATAAMIRDRSLVDDTELAVYLRTVIGLCRITKPLALELTRRFENLDRHKQVDGEYLTIDGARSLNAWLEMHEKQIGSKRNFYYVRDGGKKPKPAIPVPQLPDGTAAPKSETETATYYVVRRKSDGKFSLGGNRKWHWTDEIEYAAIEEFAADVEIAKINRADHEIVKVEATYTLTLVTPTEPEPPKPSKKAEPTPEPKPTKRMTEYQLRKLRHNTNVAKWAFEEVDGKESFNSPAERKLHFESQEAKEARWMEAADIELAAIARFKEEHAVAEN